MGEDLCDSLVRGDWEEAIDSGQLEDVCVERGEVALKLVDVPHPQEVVAVAGDLGEVPGQSQQSIFAVNMVGLQTEKNLSNFSTDLQS